MSIEKVLAKIVDKGDMLLYTAAREYNCGNPLAIVCNRHEVEPQAVKNLAAELLEMERCFTMFDRLELAATLRKHQSD